MNIYCSNLGFSLQSEDLMRLFSGYGSVSSANVITDRYTNRSRGFGFVEMPDRSAGELAIRELNGSVIDGRSIKMNEADSRQMKSSGSSTY